MLFRHEDVKSALGILIFLKSKPENEGLYKLTAVIAAAALFYIYLLSLLSYIISIII